MAHNWAAGEGCTTCNERGVAEQHAGQHRRRLPQHEPCVRKGVPLRTAHAAHAQVARKPWQLDPLLH
jgi:hypothetical protein